MNGECFAGQTVSLQRKSDGMIVACSCGIVQEQRDFTPQISGPKAAPALMKCTAFPPLAVRTVNLCGQSNAQMAAPAGLNSVKPHLGSQVLR